MNKKTIWIVMALLSSTISFAQTTPITKPITAADLDYRKDGSNYLLVLKRGQLVIASLVAFMEKEQLPGASISAIGAVQHTTVAYYNIASKHYQYKTFDSSMEVLSLNGSLGYFDHKPIVHAHISMAGPDFTVHGGHVKEAEVSLILEIFITPTIKPITRELNKDFPEIRMMTTLRDDSTSTTPQR